MKASVKESKIPLSKVVSIPPRSYPSTSIEHDNVTIFDNYLPGASTLEIVTRFSAGLRGAKSGRMLSITGPYGSGKSTMAAFLGGLLGPKNSTEWKTAYKILKKEPDSHDHTLVYARKKAGIHDSGMIRCMITARREPISVTLLRALDAGLNTYFGKYTKSDFLSAGLLRKYVQDLKSNKIPEAARLIELIEEVAEKFPIIIMIDEFGKNIEYFTTDESQQSDLFLLQELAERSGKGRKIPLFIVTLQHMAFEEYAIGASVTQRREWAKIQGRFEDIPFANSPDQTRMLISNMIRVVDIAHKRSVKRWAQQEAEITKDLGVGTGSDPELVASCYPLSPLALEILPELCSRYGQRERTLLSFISDSKRHTVATFIDEKLWDSRSLPTIGLDMLYDYFISGTGIMNASTSNASRLMEIETIIRDAHGLSELEKKILKTIGILNLVGRSGYLRASRRMIDYATGGVSRKTLASLEKKSIITYRQHADEYRIWQGTDIDIAAKLDVYRRRYQKTSLLTLLGEVIQLEPVIAAKHSIETGAVRRFERRFTLKYSDIISEDYDGVILYKTDESNTLQNQKPVITVYTGDTTDLRLAAVDVSAIQDMLKSDDEVTADWVARKELEERLAYGKIVLNREFTRSYGHAARWIYENNDTRHKLKGTPSMMVSKVCDMAYQDTPIIRNEMINKTRLSNQGATAKKKVLEAMITHTKEYKLGIDGYGPERAIYEAVLFYHGIHKQNKSFQWEMTDRKLSDTIRPVWRAMLNVIKKSKNRVVLTDIYKIAKMPPYGIRDGPLQLLIIAILIIYKNRIALYEHGTFVPKLQPEVAERMTKNPAHFELKYFKSTKSKKMLLSTVIKDLNINSKGSVLDVISHLVRVVSALPPYVIHTKNMDENSIAVRDTILNATEPDTLLFESLPKSLGFDMSKKDSSTIVKFSKELAESVNTLQNKFSDTIQDIKDMLFVGTGIEDRKKLSEAASVMLKDVEEQKMRVFLTAVSSDVLEKDEGWINYVALSLTDTPMMSWKDGDYVLFKNRLSTTAEKFKNLASIHFADVACNFAKPSYKVTVTLADGSEHHNIVSLKPEQRKKIEAIAVKTVRNMKQKGFTEEDIDALIAMLSVREEKRL